MTTLRPPTFVDVLVPVALDHTYSYRVPSELELKPGDKVSVSSARKSNPASARSSPPAFVVEQKKPRTIAQVWISPADGERFESALLGGCLVNGVNPTSAPLLARLALDPDLHERHVLVSDYLADKLSLTFGDILMVKAVA